MSRKDSRSDLSPPNPNSDPDGDPEQVFRERWAQWRERHEAYGPARSYPYAWRLPELARPLGHAALVQAWRAHALDLLALGRGAEALAVLEPTPWHSTPTLAALRARCLAMLGRPYDPPPGLTPWERALLAWQGDDAPALAQTLPDLTPGPWADLLMFWVQARRGEEGHVRFAHRAAARLREGGPAEAVRGEACMAEALHYLDAASSVVWLDHALDRCDAWGQHDLRLRLTRLLATALAASGDLGAAQRCERRLDGLLRRMQRPTS